MLQIRTIQKEDIPHLVAIYNYYVRHTIITFETEEVSEEEMERRIHTILPTFEWLVATLNDLPIGYAYYHTFRSRKAYDITVESSIYLQPELVSKGYGTQLYQALFLSAKQKGFREMISVISLPNPESVAFHIRLGFTPIGTFSKIGEKFEQYIDVAFLQKSIFHENTK